MSGGAASSGSAASSAHQARCCGRPPPRRRAADAQGLGEPPDHGVPRGELAGDGCFVWGAAPRLGRRAVQATLRVHCMPPPAPALRSSRTSRPPCHPSLAARPPPPPLQVRLKRFLEMRGADGGPWRLICGLPALWVGLLYDPQAQVRRPEGRG